MKIYSLLLIFFFNSILNISYASSRVYEPEIPNEVEIIFPKPKKYLALFKQALDDVEGYITKKNKKSFKVQGSYLKDNNDKKNFFGRARITGDLKDHLDRDKNISSLSIKLKKGNIGGIVKFRLLLPRTRNGKMEVFWSILMEELGYPVPFRKLINVNLNERKFIYIFEEKPEKEFLESYGFREGPVIEFDEREMWDNRAKISNTDKTIEKKYENYFSNAHQYKIKNKSFLKNQISVDIAYRSINPEFLGSNFIDQFKQPTEDLLKVLDGEGVYKKHKLLRLFDEVNLKYASHGLFPNNRKFYYDVIYNDYIPIYFDGNVSIRKGINYCDSIGAINTNNDQIENKIKIIKSKFIDRTIGTANFTKELECVSRQVLLKFNNSKVRLNKILPLEEIDFTYQDYLKQRYIGTKVKQRPEIYNYNNRNNQLNKCRFNLSTELWDNCKEINKKNSIKKVLSGNDKARKLNNNFKFTPFLNVKILPTLNESFETINALSEHKTINVKQNEIKYIKLNALDSSFLINLESNNSYVVLHNSSIKNSIIRSDIKKNKTKISNKIRYNQKLLTGCITVIDSVVDGSKFYSSNCNREDAINFIRVNSQNLSVNIKDSKFDAFDSDFSKINFKDIQITNAGNDCIDVSSGIYNFNQLKINGCGDKAISIGEKSIATMRTGIISNANIGIASKDLSKVYLSNNLKIKDVNKCLDAYQKKQEYGEGQIYLSEKFSSCNFSKGNLNIKINDSNSCLLVDRNYFYNTCITNKKIIFKVNKPLFEDSSFLIEILLNNKKMTKSIKASDCKYNFCIYEYDNSSDISKIGLSLNDNTNNIKYGYSEFFDLNE